MNRDTLLSLYDRLAKLVEKLPGGLQKPILREMGPVRELFLEQRPARLMLIGGTGRSVPSFLGELCGSLIETGNSESGWRTYQAGKRGRILILDARDDTPQEAVTAALAAQAPDAVLFLREDDEPLAGGMFDRAANRAAQCPATTPVVGLAASEVLRPRLSVLLNSRPEFSLGPLKVVSMSAAPAETICLVLPPPARLEFARVTGAKKAQAHIAGSLLKSFTAICGVIGLQPIPLADMPVLTTLQSLMVGLIVYTTGKRISARLITEFLGAMGFNVGAGMVLRESARAIIKFVPFWGNAVSGFIAGAGTYAIGRAAISYFIEEAPINETRKLFRTLFPEWKSFSRPSLPSFKWHKKVTPPPLPPPEPKP